MSYPVWQNWITVAELAESLVLSKRRVQQILKEMLQLGLIEMNSILGVKEMPAVSTYNQLPSFLIPIYKCKYPQGENID